MLLLSGKPLVFLLLALLATVALYGAFNVAHAMQLEDADDLGEGMEEEAASFSETDADVLEEKLGPSEDGDAEVPSDEYAMDQDYDQDFEENEGHSFLEGEENEDESADQSVDLSNMTDEEIKVVMGLLPPEDQALLHQMINEQSDDDSDSSNEL
ncbi:hypothetical protein cyc_04610 [Cyclospora cayetanensis]|uniref:Uncharacterized protein n=1 Tax=Cyclospora cayetanensis TaxID=88456 RepID=A0A1D3D4A4_9EIME|nr:hypothetical protein cyc_04610 [Cyclospora cayetanensis]